MGLFASSISQVHRPGVFPIEVASPIIIQGVSVGYVGILIQSEWGPDGAVYQPLSGGDLLDKFFPAGSARTSSGYYAMMGRKKAPWKVARILHSDATAGTLTKAGTGGNTVFTAKYKGALTITVVTAASTDGVSGSKKFTVSITDSVTGTTTEVYDNIDASMTSVDVTNSKLLASIAIDSALTAFHANGTDTFAGSSGSAVTESDYNAGLTLLALEDDVTVVVSDDCGDSIRAAVNADLEAHVLSKTDRICVLQGNSGNAWSAVKSDVASYRSDRVKYDGCWVKVKDDTGTARRSPLATFQAVAMVNLEPQQSEAWWADQVTDYYTGIDSIDTTGGFSTADESVQDDATQYGIALPIKLPSGRFAVLHDRTTSLTTSTLFGVTRRIKDYLGKSLKAGVVSWVNGPNILEQQSSLLLSVKDFLDREQVAGRIVAYSLSTAENSTVTAALGQFIIGITATTPAPMEDIFIKMNIGPTVTVVQVQ